MSCKWRHTAETASSEQDGPVHVQQHVGKCWRLHQNKLHLETKDWLLAQCSKSQMHEVSRNFGYDVGYIHTEFTRLWQHLPSSAQQSDGRCCRLCKSAQCEVMHRWSRPTQESYPLFLPLTGILINNSQWHGKPKAKLSHLVHSAKVMGRTCDPSLQALYEQAVFLGTFIGLLCWATVSRCSSGMCRVTFHCVAW